MPPLFVIGLSILLLTAPFLVASKFLLAAGVLAYAILSFASSVLAARKTEWQLLPVLPIAFTIIHLAYGSGFLVGLLKFWSRWGDHETRASRSTLLPDAGTT